jgi:hypothetical protein
MFFQRHHSQPLLEPLQSQLAEAPPPPAAPLPVVLPPAKPSTGVVAGAFPAPPKPLLNVF